jgi:hypothetical protein
MVQTRAWIAVFVILLLGVGGYVIWLNLPHTAVANKNLNVVGRRPAQPDSSKKKSLHVEGCNEDFSVAIGEIVEPRVVPGSSIEQFRSIYGKETTRDKLGNLTWVQYPYSLTAIDSNQDSSAKYVGVAVNQGHVVETLDGMELGIDTFTSIFRKMRDKKIDVQERIDHSGGYWIYTIALYSACGHKYRSEYTRTLPANAEMDKQMSALMAAQPSNLAGQPAPQLMNPFMNKVVYDYNLAISNGSDQPAPAKPSIHD